jgi:hypothetical protein
VEQLSELCLRGGGRGANQSVGRGQDEDLDARCMSPHLYKKRKGGPATNSTCLRFRRAAGVSVLAGFQLAEKLAASEF